MKWMIVRIKDERSSDICKAIEGKALMEGGLEFPFRIGAFQYTDNVVTRALNTSGQYHTNLFHDNCRCHLVPVNESDTVLYPGKQLDEIDEMMLVNSAYSYSAEQTMMARPDISDSSKTAYQSGKYDIVARVFQRVRKYVESAT